MNSISLLISFHQPVIKYPSDTNTSHLRDSFLFISRKIFSFKFDTVLNIEKWQLSFISPPERKCSRVSDLWTFLTGLRQIHEK